MKCSYCNNEVPTNAKQCPACGAPINQINAETPSMPTTDINTTMQQMMLQQQMMQQNMMNQQMINQMKEMNNSNKSRFTYIILAFFLGALGIHNFYAGHTGRAVIQLLLGFTVFGMIITIPWCILDMICINRDGYGKIMK